MNPPSTTPPPASTPRPIRIAGCSGSAIDRRHAMALLAANHPDDPVDVITGDWMSESNMTARAIAKATHPDLHAYEPTFLEALEPALPDIARHRIKVVANAGASDTRTLHRVVTDLVRRKGLDLNVAYITGDEVPLALLRDASSRFTNLCTGQDLADWPFTPVSAQAYLGGLGISLALARGADIVICGRVSDASPVIGAAHWWHAWRRDQLHELANAFVAGHLIECSSYVCGGNFTGFKALAAHGWDDIGFPIAEISPNGQVVITKNRASGGQVSPQTCTAQLLYEIQGPWYFNSDVTALLTHAAFHQLSPNRVALHGITADLPPPTTKLGLTAPGGYQAEIHWFLTGLDIPQKAHMLETQIRRLLQPHAHRFTALTFTLHGTVPCNPANQPTATVPLRILVQAPHAEDIAVPKFLRPCLDTIMQAYPGATPHLDTRLGLPRPIQEYFPTVLPQTHLHHQAHLWDGTVLPIPAPPASKAYPAQQPSEDQTADPRDVHRDFGATVRGPLGWIAHARSGDKGSDANVGLWVRHADEWPWLRSLLSTAQMRNLLGEESRPGRRIDRWEFPNLRAVHFLLHDHLDRGVSCSTSYDFLGKNVAEFLRAREVELPVRFLSRGKL